MNYYEFLKSSTTPCRKKSATPVKGLTGTEHAHRKVRLAIVQHLLDNEQLFIHNAALDCSDHNSMEDYIVAYQMRSCGWGECSEYSLQQHLGKYVPCIERYCTYVLVV